MQRNDAHQQGMLTVNQRRSDAAVIFVITRQRCVSHGTLSTLLAWIDCENDGLEGRFTVEDNDDDGAELRKPATLLKLRNDLAMLLRLR